MNSQDKYYSRYGITHPAYNVSRISGKEIRLNASKYFSGKMLEIGCGTKIKGLLVGEFVAAHIGLDHEDCPHDHANIDIFGTAYDIPNEDNEYDCILSTAVLEHLEEPQKAIEEAFRVLKPGGYAIYTMPFFWPLHEEPRDFFRYTKYGLQHLFEKAGFNIINLKPLSGYWMMSLTLWSYYLRNFSKGLMKYVVGGITIMNNWIAPYLDRGKLKDERFTWMYLIVVQKSVKES
jgi:SAM-dependent methyltransferase